MKPMIPNELVLAALDHSLPDQVPLVLLGYGTRGVLDVCISAEHESSPRVVLDL